MISAIGSVYGSSISYASVSAPQTSNATDLFNTISSSSGGDGNTLTKEQIDSYALKSKDDLNKDQSAFLKKVSTELKDSNSENISKDEFSKKYDDFQIKKHQSSADDKDNATLLNKKEDGSTESVLTQDSGTSALTLFLQSHSDSGNDITKAEMLAYLNSLISNGNSNTNEVAQIKKIITKMEASTPTDSYPNAAAKDKTIDTQNVVSTVEYRV